VRTTALLLIGVAITELAVWGADKRR